MSKLRNWWPSDEALERSRSSNLATTGAAAVAAANDTSNNAVTDTARALMSSRSPYNLQTQILDPLHASATVPSSSPTAAPATATIRLSEVAAALNAMPSHLSSPSKSTPTEQNSSSPSPHLSLSRPVIKLTNTEDHKEELLKKLLCRSESSSDLTIGLQHNARPTSLPASPQTQAVHLQKNHATGTVERRMQYSKTEGKACTNLLANEDSADLRKRKRDHTALTLRSSTLCTNQDTQEQRTSSSGTLKESLSRREIHIFSERERRKGMAHLYAILHSLLPDAKPKTDRCTVLTEAMEYIHELQMRLDDLGRQKNEIVGPIREQLNVDSSAGIGSVALHGGMDGAESGPHMPNVGMNDLISEEMRQEILAAADVVVRFCGQDAFITLNSPKGKGVWSTILNVLHQQNLELLNVTLSTSNDMDYHCIHAKMSNSELQSQELQKMLEDVVLKHAILDDQD